MHFIIHYQPRRPKLLETMTEAEQQVIGAHFAYLKAHFDAGRAPFVGRREDAAFGERGRGPYFLAGSSATGTIGFSDTTSKLSSTEGSARRRSWLYQNSVR